MKIRKLAVLLAASLTLSGQSAPPAPAIATARKALDLLLSGKYPEFSALLSPLAKQRLTPDFLQQQVGPELKDFGKVESIGEPVTAMDGTNSLPSFPVHFAQSIINIQFTVNAGGQIAGLYLRPADAPLPVMWMRPSYSKQNLFRKRDVTVGDDQWKLGGTIVEPTGKGPFPAVVLVHGPGPDDRDETIYSNHIFRDLAEGLASNGIAVLRYDKRTKVYGDKMGDLDFTIQDETVDDAVRAAALLRQQPEIDGSRIFVLGHSLGGYISPRIAAKDGKLAGLIFFAANARPIEDVAMDQNDYLVHQGPNPPSEVLKRLDDLKAEVAKVKKLEPGKTNPPVVMGLPSAYLLDLKGYDPVAQAKRLTVPMLFLQGGRDFQVTTKDLDLWKAGLASKKDTTFRVYPPLNHLFITGTAKSTPSEYRTPGNVDGSVITDIVAFVLPHKN